MIKARKVSKTYKMNGQDIKAVDNVSFECAKGEYISIVGHSGSGKSTLLSLIGGLTKPDSGDIVIDSKNLFSMDDNALSEFRNKKLNFIFQFSSLFPTLTAIENVMLPTAFSSKRNNKDAMKQEAVRLLDMLGLKDKLSFYPSQLSGGQQRRVAIARAFINNPEIILADEPTGDLDEETESEVMKIFKRMNEERGITFLVVTHSSAIAIQGKRTMKMQGGKLEEL